MYNITVQNQLKAWHISILLLLKHYANIRRKIKINTTMTQDAYTQKGNMTMQHNDATINRNKITMQINNNQ